MFTLLDDTEKRFLCPLLRKAAETAYVSNSDSMNINCEVDDVDAFMIDVLDLQFGVLVFLNALVHCIKP